MVSRSKSTIILEIVADSVASAIAADKGGADRIELCAALHDGGLTPSDGMLEAVLDSVRIPVYVLVRPRPGGFEYSKEEVDVIERDVRRIRKLGAKGVVVGVLRRDRTVDVARMKALLGAAAGMDVTFHRAIDEVRQPFQALDMLADMGVRRILSSGQKESAFEGRIMLREMVEHSRGRVRIMAGAGVERANIRQIVRSTGVKEIHVGTGAMRLVKNSSLRSNLFGSAMRQVDAAQVRKIVALLNELSAMNPREEK